MKMKRNKNFFPALSRSLVGGVLLSIGVVASSLLPAGTAWAVETNFYGNQKLGDSSIYSGVTVTRDDTGIWAKKDGYQASAKIIQQQWWSVAGVNYQGTANDVTKNEVIISVGETTNLYGGISSSTSATENTVTINGTSTTVGTVYGGTTFAATSESTAYKNKVAVSGGAQITVALYGGCNYKEPGEGVNEGSANGNIVTLEDTNTTAKTVYGGAVVGQSGGSTGSANSNEVTVSNGAKVTKKLYGGYSTNGAATGNKVTLKGGTVGTSSTNGAEIYGGSSGSGDAKNNEVTINAGNAGEVYVLVICGGLVQSDANAKVQGNKVVINSGNVTITDSSSYGIIGGGSLVGTAGGTGENEGNKVEVTGGTVKGNVSGGMSQLAATGNSVIVTGGTVKGEVYGGKSVNGAANSNEVTIKGGTLGTSDVVADVYGGYSESDTATTTGNTVAIVATSEAFPVLTYANLYGSNKAVTAAVTGDDANVLDLTQMATNVTANSIGNFNVVKMGAGTLTVTANSDLSYATIDATAITSISGDSHDLIVASNGQELLNYNDSTKVTGTDALKGYAVDTTAGGTGGVATQSYKGAITAKKISIVKDATGTNVAGLYIDSNGKGYNKDDLTKGEAKSGTLTISSDVSKTGRTYYGAYAEGSSEAKGGTLEVKTGGSIENVYGGYSESGTVTGNTANITGGTVKSIVYGGKSDSSAVTSNTVNVTGGTITSIYGGSSESGTVTSNTVNVTGGRVNSIIYGGYSKGSGAATSNTVNVTGGTANGSVYGGKSDSGAATSNTVNVTGGAATKSVYGGYAKTDATGNSVTLKGGTVGTSQKAYDVYGGYSTGGVAKSNTVNVEDGTANGSVYGGYAKTDATGNSVTLKGGTVGTSDAATNVYGGYSKSGTATGNKVAIVATDDKKPDLTNANLYGSNKDVTTVVTGDDANVLDLTQMATNITANSIGNFNVVKMGVGVLTVKAASDLSYANIDATAITTIDGTRDLILAEGGASLLSYNDNTKVVLSEEVQKPFLKDVATGGIYTNKVTVEKNSTKLSLTLEVGTNVAGVYYKDGKGYNASDLTSGTATSGTLTISTDVTGTGKTYYGSYAEESSEAKGGTLEVKTDGKVSTVNGGYSKDGAVTGNTATVTGGTVNGYIYGGKSDIGAVTSNTATIAGGTVIDAVVGGFSRSGAVTSNTATVTDGTVTGSFYGGKSDIGTVMNNTVNITGGNVGNVVGGFSGSDAVTSNTATITGGTVTGKIYGGYSTSGAAESNKVTIGGSDTQVSGNVFGGYSKGSGASLNEVSIEDAAKIEGKVYGGYRDNNVQGNVQGNKVTITGGTVNNLVYGAWNKMGNAISNEVTISGGTVGNKVRGGYTNSGDATSNKVTITGGIIEKGVYGGYSGSNAIDNKIYIDGGTVTGDAYGAYGDSNVTGNKIYIADGTMKGDVYGGYSASGAATGNEVYIEGGTITGNVYGGKGATTSDNKVIWSGGVVNGTVEADEIKIASKVDANPLMSFNAAKVIAEGTWNFTSSAYKNADATTSITGDLTGSGAYYFYLDENVKANDPFITVSGTADLTNATVGVGILKDKVKETTAKLEKDGKVYLVKANTVTTSAKTLTNDTTGMAVDTIAAKYKFDLENDGQNLIAIYAGKGISEQAKALAEIQAASSILVTDAMVYGAEEGMGAATLAASEVGGSDAYVGFGTIGFGNMRTNTGSHVDTKGYNLVAGAAKQNLNKNGSLTTGIFVEYGRSNSESVCDSGDYGEIVSKGNGHYIGGGLMAKQLNKSGTYYEGSLRVGKVNSEYESDNIGDIPKHDASATYYGIHLGYGKVFNMGKDVELDVYGKYFYSHVGGRDINIDGSDFSFDATNSHLLRVGTRWTVKSKGGFRNYVGLALQNEFAGSQDGRAEDMTIDAPSQKGFSGMLELGTKRAFDSRNKSFWEVGLKGYVGRRQGVLGQVKLEWQF